MKVTVYSLIAAVLMTGCLAVSPCVAQTSATKTAAAPAAKAAPHNKIPDVKYPYTFVCKHCGLKITVKTPADWLKPCPVCPCGVLTVDCLPDQKPGKK